MSTATFDRPPVPAPRADLEQRPAYEPVGDRARAAMVALAVAAAGTVATGALDLAGYVVLDNAMEAGRPAAAAADDVALRNDLGTIGGAVFAVTGLAVAICVLRWLLAAYRNVERLNPAAKRYRTVWAVLGWFVPIWHFFRPKQVVNDIWRASDPAEPPPWLGLWWALWLVGAMLATDRGRDGGEIVANLRRDDLLNAVSSVFLLGAALLGIMLVRLVTDRQEAHERRLQRAGRAQP